MNRSKHLHRNVSFHKLAKEFQTLSHQILLLANQGFLRPDFQREVSRMILDFSGADEVELWLKDHGKYFRSVVKRHPPNPFLFGIRSSAQNEDGEIIPGPEDDPDLICLCNNIIRGQVEPSPLLTENGSFLTGHSKKPFSLRLKTFKNSHDREFKISVITPPLS